VWGSHWVVSPNSAAHSISLKTRYNAPISTRLGGGKAMVSHLFYYPLAFFALVWLFVMWHDGHRAPAYQAVSGRTTRRCAMPPARGACGTPP